MNVSYYFTEDGIFELLESIFSSGEGSESRFLVYIIAAIVVGGYFMQEFFDNKNTIWLSITLIAISGLEFYYHNHESNFIWFCSEPRWWWIAINFLIYAFVCYAQGQLLINQSIRASYGMPYFGLCSVPVCLIALYATVYFYSPAVPYVIWTFILCQAIQVIVILVRTTAVENVLKAIIHSVAYTICMFATLMLGYHLLVMLIFVAIGMCAAWFLEGGSNSSTSHSSNNYTEGFVYTMGNQKFVKLNNGEVHEIWGESETGVLRDSKGMDWHTNGGLGNARSYK